PSVGIVAFQQSGRIFHLGPAWKYQPDAMLPKQMEYHDITSVLLRIRWLHGPGIKQRGRFPLDLFANSAVDAQNNPPQTLTHRRQRVVSVWRYRHRLPPAPTVLSPIPRPLPWLSASLAARMIQTLAIQEREEGTP